MFKESSKRVLLCFLIHTVFVYIRVEAVSDASKLCTNRSISCSIQVNNGNISDEDCEMEYYPRNGNKCSSLIMDGQTYTNQLGKVLLQTYTYTWEFFSQVAFNVTFLDINWTNATMRFSWNGHPENNTCRTFHVSKNFLAHKPSTLFYDCLWSESEYEGKTYNFEYVARNSTTTDYRKYVFVVPKTRRHFKSALKSEIFMYIDISNLPEAIILIQTVPGVTKYILKRYKNDEIQEEKLLVANENDFEVNDTQNIGILTGTYYFTVQPVSDACGKDGCIVSKSPDLKIYSSLDLFHLGIAMLALVSLAVISMYLYLKLSILKAKDPKLSERPTLLLIYRSTHTYHINVVKEVARYFMKHFNVRVLVDELDVKSEDPFTWYSNTIDGADFIAIVSSPTCCDSISGIYPNVYEAALCLLRGRRFNKEHLWNSYNLMVFELPYCSEKDLPLEAKNIGLRYKVPAQLNEIYTYIHNSRLDGFILKSFHWIKARIGILWSLTCKRSYLDQRCNWPEILSAIKEARAEVESCKIKGNKGNLKNVNEIRIFKDSPKVEREDEKFADDVDKKEGISEINVVDHFEPFQSFPGRLDDFDLLGTGAEKVGTEVIIKKTDGLVIDDLIM